MIRQLTRKRAPRDLYQYLMRCSKNWVSMASIFNGRRFIMVIRIFKTTTGSVDALGLAILAVDINGRHKILLRTCQLFIHLKNAWWLFAIDVKTNLKAVLQNY